MDERDREHRQSDVEPLRRHRPVRRVARGRPVRRLEELAQIEALADRMLDLHPRIVRAHTLAQITHGARRMPVHGLVLGTQDKQAPTFVVVGGVHGLERIGTRVVIAWMQTLAELLDWDRVFLETLRRIRIVIVPLVNPVGMLERTRSNGSGVDLMRNAPGPRIAGSSFLVGGHRLSAKLPWYMGDLGDAMQPEAAGLCRFIEDEVFDARVAISLDCHSGFGLVDRIWFPYARTRAPFPELAEVFALRELLDQTLPHHVYQFEPQAKTYTVRGDLWDYLHDRFREVRPRGVFIPLTLEMGSWAWVRKNPRQALDLWGGFNPVKPHRLKRTLRRHVPLFDFLLRATGSPESWARLAPATRDRLAHEAFKLWYVD